MNDRYTTFARKTFLCFLLVCSVGSSVVAHTAQSSNQPALVSASIQRAQTLLQSGDVEAAIAILESSARLPETNAEAWHVLGTAYKQKGESKKAAKAFRQAYESRFGFAEQFRYVRAPKEGESTDNLAERSKRAALYYEDAANSLEQLLTVDGKAAQEQREDVNRLRQLSADLRTETLKKYVKYVYSSTEVDTKVVILEKPHPKPSGADRAHSSKGRVEVRLLLADDGVPRFPKVVSTTAGEDFTRSALNAAQRIRYKPAIKDGRTVSTYALISYAYNTY